MSTLEERKTMSENVMRVVPMACNGNKFAERYLYDIALVNQIIDDLVDKDHDVTSEKIERAFWILAVSIPSNPFFVENYKTLLSQHAVIYNSWMDANAWEKSENKDKKIHASVLKSSIFEIIPLVAFLTGGHEAMRRISLHARELFFDKESDREKI